MSNKRTIHGRKQATIMVTALALGGAAGAAGPALAISQAPPSVVQVHLVIASGLPYPSCRR
jgi:hypothetical protein